MARTVVDALNDARDHFDEFRDTVKRRREEEDDDNGPSLTLQQCQDALKKHIIKTLGEAVRNRLDDRRCCKDLDKGGIEVTVEYSDYDCNGYGYNVTNWLLDDIDWGRFNKSLTKAFREASGGKYAFMSSGWEMKVSTESGDEYVDVIVTFRNYKPL